MSYKANNNYEIKVFRTNQEVESLRCIWEQMQWHPNADIDFYFTIHRYRPEIIRPHVMVVFEKMTPKAIIVGRLEKSSIDVRLGYKSLFAPQVLQISVVYGGILGDVSDPTIMELVLSELISALKHREADVILLRDLDVSCNLLDIARSHPNYFLRDHVPHQTLHRKITLPSSFDEVYKKISSKHRNHMQRMKRMLEKDYQNVRIKIYRQGDNVKDLCKDIEEVAKKTYQRGIGAGFANNEENYRRMELSARRNWLRIYLIYIDNIPVAFWISTIYKNRGYLSSTGYDPQFKKYELGTTLFWEMVKDLCREGIIEIDLGFGDAGYKERFGNFFWKESSVYIFAPTFKGVWINITRTIISLLILRLMDRIRKSDLAGYLKRKWRNYLIPKNTVN